MLHVDAGSFCLVYATQLPSIGTVVIRSEFGERTITEAAATTYHKIVVDGLTADTTYRYMVDGIHSGKIRTDTERGALKFAVFGHPGGSMSPGAFPHGALAGVLNDTDPDFALCTGDLCNYTNQRSFRELFFEPFQALGQRRAIYVSAGNHEYGFPEREGPPYATFRTLFPYDFAGTRGPFHTFTRGNVQFFAVSYLPIDDADLEEQVEWLERELAASRSEFRVVFLGGKNQDSSGSFETLVKTMAAGGVDAIFGGDGSRSFEDKLEGIDYFFAGTNRLDPHDFYLVETRPYSLVVRKMNAALSADPQVWIVPSRRERVITADLLPMLSVREDNEAELAAFGIGIPGEEAHGVRMTLMNPTEDKVYVRFHWAPSSLGDEPRASRMFRAHVPVIEPGAIRLVEFPLPDVDPLSGAPIDLGSIEIRIHVGKDREREGVLKWIKRLETFSDPLRTP